MTALAYSTAAGNKIHNKLCSTVADDCSDEVAICQMMDTMMAKDMAYGKLSKRILYLVPCALCSPWHFTLVSRISKSPLHKTSYIKIN